MVSSFLPSPKRPYDETVPRCKVCDVPFPSGKWDSDEIGYCEEHMWAKGYMGPKRKNQCFTCFNNVGKGNKVLCAFQMMQREDGSWVDPYGKTHKEYMVAHGMDKRLVPVKPERQTKSKYACEGYDNNKGMTREQLRLADPEFFYSRKRFW